MSPTPPPVAQLASINVTDRIPQFWTDMPRLWFAQFESAMEPQKQGDAAKFHLVISRLTRDALQQVSDLIFKPPTDNKYGALKQRLLTAYEESAERQFQKLVGEMDLGSQRPSHLLRRMSELAQNTEVPTEALQRLWISRLPGPLKAVLSVCQDQKAEKLAEMADKIMENLNSAEVATVSSTAATATTDMATVISGFTTELQELRREVNEIRGRSRGRGNHGNRRRTQSRSRGPRRTPESPNWLCSYHYAYGTEARRCTKPCNWKENSRAEN